MHQPTDEQPVQQVPSNQATRPAAPAGAVNSEQDPASKEAWHRAEMKRLLDEAMHRAQISEGEETSQPARNVDPAAPPADVSRQNMWESTHFGDGASGGFTTIRRDGATESIAWVDCRPGKPPKPARLILSCLMIAIISALALGPFMGMVSQSWPTALGVIVGLALGFGPMLLFSDPRAHARKARIEVSPNGLGIGAPPSNGQSWSAASRIALGDLVRFEARDGASGDIIYSQHAASAAASMPMYGGAVGYMTGGGVGAGVGMAAGAVAGGVSVATNAIGNQMRRGRAEYKAMLAATGCVVVAVVKRQPDVVLAGGFAPDVAGQLVDKLVECVEENLDVVPLQRAALQSARIAVGADKAPAAISRAQYCRKCGFKLTSDDRFCGGCGAKLV